MRVAIVTESLPPDVNGVANSVLRVAEHLVARGHEPMVIAPQPALGNTRVPGPLPYPVRRISSVGMPGYPGFRLGLPGRDVQLAMREHRPDVVHLASPFVLGAWGATAAAKLDLPVVAVYQTNVPGYAGAYRMSYGERTAWWWLRRVHGRAARTLAPHGELLVGYVGRLTVEKRIDLLATVSRRPFIKVVIIGDGRDACTVRPGRTRAGRESHVDSRG